MSYSRVDNDVNDLRHIAALLADHGEPYLDDLHFPPGEDREVAVRSALERADMFVAVISPNYLKSSWTNLEVGRADERRIPMYALHNSTLLKIESSTELLEMIRATRPERPL